MSKYAVETPNVVIENPKARKIAGIALDVTGLILGSAIVLDASTPAIDIEQVTVPAIALWSYLRAGFGLSVTSRNIPS